MKIQLPKRVVYRGEKIPANTPFTIDKKDLDHFVTKGAWILEENAKEEKAIGDPQKNRGESEPLSSSTDSGSGKTK